VNHNQGEPIMSGKSFNYLGKFCSLRNAFNIGGLFMVVLIAGCKTYSVSLNNNVVYTPLPLFKDFAIADTHLSDCVEQTINDKKITKAEELKQLNCSNAGIKSLAGLETFYHLEQLNLSENNLQSIFSLKNFSKLEVLILRKNNLTSAEPLLGMLTLRELDVSENAKLACGDLKQLAANFTKEDLKLALPEQCK
jgi:Leucine-rich repeat (LRR) protein